MNLAASQARSNIFKLSKCVLELVEKEIGRRLDLWVDPGEKDGRGFEHPDLGAFLVPLKYLGMWKEDPEE